MSDRAKRLQVWLDALKAGATIERLEVGGKPALRLPEHPWLRHAQDKKMVLVLEEGDEDWVDQMRTEERLKPLVDHMVSGGEVTWTEVRGQPAVRYKVEDAGTLYGQSWGQGHQLTLLRDGDRGLLHQLVEKQRLGQRVEAEEAERFRAALEVERRQARALAELAFSNDERNVLRKYGFVIVQDRLLEVHGTADLKGLEVLRRALLGPIPSILEHVWQSASHGQLHYNDVCDEFCSVDRALDQIKEELEHLQQVAKSEHKPAPGRVAHVPFVAAEDDYHVCWVCVEPGPNEGVVQRVSHSYGPFSNSLPGQPPTITVVAQSVGAFFDQVKAETEPERALKALEHFAKIEPKTLRDKVRACYFRA